MTKKFWTSYSVAKSPRIKKRHNRPKVGRSRRAHEIDLEQAQNIRKKVIAIVIGLAIVYFIFLFFFSKIFRIQSLEISGESQVPTQQAEEIIWQSIDGRVFGLFPADNYFLLKKSAIQKKFESEGILVELKLEKKFPKTLKVNLTDRLGQIIWVSAEQFYMMNLKGLIEKQLPVKDLVNVKLPVVYDLSNSGAETDIRLIDQKLVDLILEIYQNFAAYELPIIEVDYFKVDSPEANYVKIVTKQGFEIHVNYLNTLESQLNKLQKSLSAGKIDLENLNYINLRIENQVIYK